MDRHASRRERLQQLIADRYGGNVAALADAMNKKRPQIYRLFTTAKTARNVGDGLAREIEEFHKLPFGWLDGVDHPASGTNFLDQLMDLQERYHLLAEAEKNMVDTYLKRHPALGEAFPPTNKPR